MGFDLIVRSRTTGGSLWQGDIHAACSACGKFDQLVLCAQELQLPEGASRPGFQIIAAPNDDADLTREQLMIAQTAAARVTRAFAAGKRSLITCRAGRNRSGLVTALVLTMFYGVSGKTAIEVVKRQRKNADAPALTNPSFNRFLSEIPARAINGKK